MATIWQQLGAFVVTAENVANEHLDQFAAAGGRWLVPVLKGSDTDAKNLELLPSLKTRAKARGLRTGCWVNGFGPPDDPTELASRAKDLCTQYALSPCIFDLEEQYKNENAPLLPRTLSEARRLMPGRSIGCSSFGFADRAMIWNGRTLSPPASLYDQKVRWLPQWYYRYAEHFAADLCMEDLQRHGPFDGNIRDTSAPGRRGIPLSYAHGTLYVTGIEGSDLGVGVDQIRRAKAHGFTYGFSIYNLENTRQGDFDLLRSVQGELFLV